MNPFRTHLHEQALSISKNFRSLESELIDILQRIEEARVHLEMGYPSLFEYATKELKLSEGNAYAFTRISRKAKEVPQLKEEIKSGAITVSNAKQILPVLTVTNQNEWIEKAKSLSKRELEREVVRENPESARKEFVRVVQANRVSIKIEISDTCLEKLKRAQTLLSSHRRKNATIEETFEQSLDLFLDKKDPLKKAFRALFKSNKDVSLLSLKMLG